MAMSTGVVCLAVYLALCTGTPSITILLLYHNSISINNANEPRILFGFVLKFILCLSLSHVKLQATSALKFLLIL
jgi:hypothetical protein